MYGYSAPPDNDIESLNGELEHIAPRRQHVSTRSLSSSSKRRVYLLCTALLGWVLSLSLSAVIVGCGIAYYVRYWAPDACGSIRPVSTQCLLPLSERYNATRLLSDEFNIEMHKILRERAVDTLIHEKLDGDDDGMILIVGANKKNTAGGEVINGASRQIREFVYLTGVLDFMDMLTLIDLRTRDFVLFQPRYDREKAIWEWPHLYTLEEMREKFGASSVQYTDDLDTMLHRYNRSTLHLVSGQQWPIEGDYTFIPRETDDTSLSAVLSSIRAVKIEHELEVMNYANAVSKMAHLRLMRNVAPGMHEYQLESLFRSDTMNCGLNRQAYAPIVGSGVNSAVLHYVQNKRRIQEGGSTGINSDLVLVDAGAEFLGYASDITRTFPSGGTFSDSQRMIYNIVLAAQEAALKQMKPGTPWSTLDRIARRTIIEGLSAANFTAPDVDVDTLINNGIDRLFMPHGLGHLVGLDVHDTTVYPVTPLLTGMVVTCEPGIYFRDFLFESLPEETKKLLNMDKISQFYEFGGIRIEGVCVCMYESCLTVNISFGVPY